MRQSRKSQATPVPQAAPEVVADTRNYTLERDTEVIPAARELLARLAVRQDLAIGSSQTVTEDVLAEYYKKVYIEDVVPMLRARNLRVSDVPFLFSIMLQSVQLLKDITESSMHMNEDLANAKKWGVADMADLRVDALEAVLMADTTVPPVESVAPTGESVKE